MSFNARRDKLKNDLMSQGFPTGPQLAEVISWVEAIFSRVEALEKSRPLVSARSSRERAGSRKTGRKGGPR